MSVEVAIYLNGVRVPVMLDEEALAAIGAALPSAPVEPERPFLTIPEAADLLRAKRQRVDDLLSAGKLPRHKDGARTLVSRAELLAYLNGGRG
jgi:excisionase family DNA binding protein